MLRSVVDWQLRTLAIYCYRRCRRRQRCCSPSTDYCKRAIASEEPSSTAHCGLRSILTVSKRATTRGKAVVCSSRPTLSVLLSRQHPITTSTFTTFTPTHHHPSLFCDHHHHHHHHILSSSPSFLWSLPSFTHNTHTSLIHRQWRRHQQQEHYFIIAIVIPIHSPTLYSPTQ